MEQAEGTLAVLCAESSETAGQAGLESVPPRPPVSLGEGRLAGVCLAA